jgi:hypothetical protein
MKLPDSRTAPDSTTGRLSRDLSAGTRHVQSGAVREVGSAPGFVDLSDAGSSASQ